MAKEYKELFTHIEKVEPPKDLMHKILLRIEVAERRALRQKAIVFGTSSVALFGVVVTLFTYISQMLSEAGFYQYLALAFSDGSAFGMYWKEFTLALLDTVPVVSVILALTSVALFVWSSAQTLYFTKQQLLKTT